MVENTRFCISLNRWKCWRLCVSVILPKRQTFGCFRTESAPEYEVVCVDLPIFVNDFGRAATPSSAFLPAAGRQCQALSLSISLSGSTRQTGDKVSAPFQDETRRISQGDPVLTLLIPLLAVRISTSTLFCNFFH